MPKDGDHTNGNDAKRKSRARKRRAGEQRSELYVGRQAVRGLGNDLNALEELKGTDPTLYRRVIGPGQRCVASTVTRFYVEALAGRMEDLLAIAARENRSPAQVLDLLISAGLEAGDSQGGEDRWSTASQAA